MRVVGIGGGHGLALSLRAARLYAEDIAAVVTVADDGGSSGRLVRELGVPPPGDIRNCLIALARNESMAGLYQHRFESGELTGHPLGNLLIAALTEMTGDFTSAVQEAGKLLECDGRVYPSTTEIVDLRALVNGDVVRGQVAVAQTEQPIQAVYLKPADPPACAEAVQAICAADQIILGPGSLFTSLIATLLVPGIRDALRGARGKRILVANNRVQKGETSGLDGTAHVESVLAHIGANTLDAVVVQAPVLQADGIDFDRRAIENLGIEVFEGDVSTDAGVHDPGALAEAFQALGAERDRRPD
ncbi:MAG: gluconeogenesis factor YvcK family protein [Actinomycetota bacterium]